MTKILDRYTYEEQELICETCNWQGKGADANLIDLYGVSVVQELHCPNCDALIATIKIDE